MGKVIIAPGKYVQGAGEMANFLIKKNGNFRDNFSK